MTDRARDLLDATRDVRRLIDREHDLLVQRTNTLVAVTAFLIVSFFGSGKTSTPCAHQAIAGIGVLLGGLWAYFGWRGSVAADKLWTSVKALESRLGDRDQLIYSSLRGGDGWLTVANTLGIVLPVVSSLIWFCCLLG